MRSPLNDCFILFLFLLFPSFSFCFEKLLLTGKSQASNAFIQQISVYREKNKQLSLQERVSYAYEKGRLKQKRYFNESLSLYKIEEYRYSLSGSWIIEGLSIPEVNRLYKKKYHHSGYLIDELKYLGRKTHRIIHKIVLSKEGRILTDLIRYSNSDLRETKSYHYDIDGYLKKMLWTSTRPSKTTHYFSETKEEKIGWYLNNQEEKIVFLQQRLTYLNDLLTEIKHTVRGERSIIKIDYTFH